MAIGEHPILHCISFLTNVSPPHRFIVSSCPIKHSLKVDAVEEKKIHRRTRIVICPLFPLSKQTRDRNEQKKYPVKVSYTPGEHHLERHTLFFPPCFVDRLCKRIAHQYILLRNEFLYNGCNETYRILSNKLELLGCYIRCRFEIVLRNLY